MAKVILGKRPKNFKHTVTVPLHGGESGTIKFNFIYRTKKEFGEFIDELFKDADVKPTGASEEEVKFSLGEALSKSCETQADYIMKIADGWDLDVDFSRDAVEQLCNELPGAAAAAVNDYRAACTEGRLGN